MAQASFVAVLGACVSLALGCVTSGRDTESNGAPEEAEEAIRGAPKAPFQGRVITADVVAIDQVYVYNRFGSFNPAGMIFALERDVVPIDPSCALGPGNAMLRDGKRPRPLVLRANVGDTLVIHFKNLLAPAPVDDDQPATRAASIHVNGLQPLDHGSLGG